MNKVLYFGIMAGAAAIAELSDRKSGVCQGQVCQAGLR